MDTNATTPFWAENIVLRLKSLFQQYKYPFLSALIFGLLAHGFALTNKLVGNDELHHLFLKGTTIESGRWGLELTPFIFPDFSMPWIYGILSILMVAVAVCLMVDMLQIRSKALQLLMGGLIVTFPTLTATLIYMFTCSSYALSFLLSALAAWLFHRGGLWRQIFGVLCLTFSIGIYQAYVSVTASLLVLVLIRQVLSQQAPVKDLLRKGICFVLLLGISAVLYYGILQLIFQFSGQDFGGYASAALQGASGLITNAYHAYKFFVTIFFTNRYGLIITPFSRVAHLFCLLVILVEILLWLRTPKQKGSGLLLLFLGGILPLAINCIFLISAIAAVHTLMLYSTVSIYLLAAIMLDPHIPALTTATFGGKLRSAAVNIVPLCMALIILINTYIANEVPLKLHLMYENSYSLCTSINTQFQQTPGYTQQTPVVITGDQGFPSFDGQFDHLQTMIGQQTMFLVNINYQNMFRYYLGAQMNLVDDPAIIEAVTATDAYTQMPCYPDYGSIRMLDGIMVVKFS